jgi:hypothetical protein
METKFFVSMVVEDNVVEDPSTKRLSGSINTIWTCGTFRGKSFAEILEDQAIANAKKVVKLLTKACNLETTGAESEKTNVLDVVDSYIGWLNADQATADDDYTYEQFLEEWYQMGDVSDISFGYFLEDLRNALGESYRIEHDEKFPNRVIILRKSPLEFVLENLIGYFYNHHKYHKFGELLVKVLGRSLPQ